MMHLTGKKGSTIIYHIRKELAASERISHLI